MPSHFPRAAVLLRSKHDTFPTHRHWSRHGWSLWCLLWPKEAVEKLNYRRSLRIWGLRVSVKCRWGCICTLLTGEEIPEKAQILLSAHPLPPRQVAPSVLSAGSGENCPKPTWKWNPGARRRAAQSLTASCCRYRGQIPTRCPCSL